MKVRIEASRKGTRLYDGAYDVTDAKSFGNAFADLWNKLVEKRLRGASSVGAVYEQMDDGATPNVAGIQIAIKRADS
jgi:hypothetical protein